jgi:GNAT superfamily N-acetyltransferase
LPEEGEQVRLRDGSRVLVRPVTPGDRELFVQGFERFGMESRASRFLGLKKKLSDRELDYLTQVDHESHEAVGAIDLETGAGVGVARMVRSPNGDPSCAEAAVAVVDDWQGRGLGALLLSRLVARARELGVTHFLAVLRTDNRSMLTLFQRAGEVHVRDREGEIATIEVELPVDCEHDSLGAALRSAAAGEIAPAGD